MRITSYFIHTAFYQLAIILLVLICGCTGQNAGQSDDPVTKWRQWRDNLIAEDMKDTPEKLISKLESSDAIMRVAAYQATMDRGMEMFPVMLQTDWKEKYRALDVFHILANRLGAQAVPQCIEAIEKSNLVDDKTISEDESIIQARPGWNAVDALTEIGPPAKDAVPILLKRMELIHTNMWLLSGVPDALASIGDGSEQVITGLLKLLDEKDAYDAHVSACLALGRLASPDNKQVIDRLIEIRDHSTVGPVTFWPLIIAARCALYELGVDKQDQISELKKLEQATYGEFHTNAMWVWDGLIAIKAPEAVDILRNAVLNYDKSDELLAITDLAKLAPTPEIIDILTQALSVNSGQVAFWPAVALGQYGSDASSALPALQEAYKMVGNDEKDRETKSAIEEAIIRISEGISK
jgi:hypothetical protein